MIYLGYVNDNYYAFHYMTNDISQELFGIALTTLGLSIFLFINGSLVVVAFFKLRTYREIENIKWVKETIKQIENKDLRFFFRGLKSEPLRIRIKTLEEICEFLFFSQL